MRIRTKKHRLPPAAYIGEVSVSFTACEAHRRDLFLTPEIVGVFVEELAEACQLHRCVVPIYCFMPDHLHAIVAGLDRSSKPKVAMERFKHETGAWLKQNLPDREWQDDFYDHIVRKRADWKAQLQYVAGNPVRAGLVEDLFAYPFTGSIGTDWKHEIIYGL